MTRQLSTLVIAFLLTAHALDAQAPAPLSQDQLVAKLAATLDSLTAAGEFSGAVAVDRAGKRVFAGAYGVADQATKRPNTLQTEFNIGSINKVFTAIAIRQLAAAGKLDLDSSLGHYWPEYPNPTARRATIRQLLDHQAGLGGSIFEAPPGGARHDVAHNRDYLQLFVNQPQAFEPGTSRRYCNPCYVVLGILVERLSGEDYYEYVQRHIYAPAGMTHTRAYMVDSLPANAAIGYTRGEDENAPPDAPLGPNTAMLPGRGSAAGGGYSTVGDLLLFLDALRAGKIPSGPAPGIGIAGGAPGLNAALEGELPGKYDIAVASNLDPPAAERIVRLVRQWLGAAAD